MGSLGFNRMEIAGGVVVLVMLKPGYLFRLPEVDLHLLTRRRPDTQRRTQLPPQAAQRAASSSRYRAR